jgi:hypothetical protein
MNSIVIIISLCLCAIGIYVAGKSYIRSLHKHIDKLQKHNIENAIEIGHHKQHDLILGNIIKCIDSISNNESLFNESLKQVADNFREFFNSEYCAIGKVADGVVEDCVFSYDYHNDIQKYNSQKQYCNIVRRINVSNKNYIICNALNDFDNDAKLYSAGEIRAFENENFSIYENYILKSHNLLNVFVIALRNESRENVGYIQLINVSKIDKLPSILKDSLTRLLSLVVINEKIQYDSLKNEQIVRDASFLIQLQGQRRNFDKVLDSIMEYLSKEFNAQVISFRIPLLNGDEKEPLFYLRRCYASPKIVDRDKLIAYYYKDRIIKRKDEMGGYDMLRCINGNMVVEDNAKDVDYYSAYDLNLATKTLIMPIMRDFGLNKCNNEQRKCSNTLCNRYEKVECLDRFTKLYGVFKLRVANAPKQEQTDEITIQRDQEEAYYDAKNRLSFLSKQITLLLNSIIDKDEAESLITFKQLLKESSFINIRDFDIRCVKIIQQVIQSKVCSLYRYNDIDKVLYLSATTANNITFNGQTYRSQDIITQCKIDVADTHNVIAKVFENKSTECLINWHDENVHQCHFFERIDTGQIIGESIMLMPMISKNSTVLGVIVLVGKSSQSSFISPIYWEPDKNHIEFIVDVLTRITEADTERLTFLSHLSHELLSPVTMLVYDNDNIITTAERNKDVFTKDRLISQLKDNLDKNMLFKYIVEDIEYIYSLTKGYMDYNIVKQDNPQQILIDIVRLFEAEAHAEKGVSIILNISNMPPLFFDRPRMKQVFINLLKNAIRYSNPNSTIEVYYKCDNYYHEIKFANTGIGIREEEKDLIFELFYRGIDAKHKIPRGTGFGLYLTREIMRAHNGDCIIRKLHSPTEISIILPININ